MDYESPQKRRWGRWTMLVGAVLITAGLLAYVRSRRVPSLTESRFAAARTQWSENAPENYTIRVEVSGMQPGIYEVVVENELPVAASFDGNPLRRRRTFGTWAVTGMFETITRDLETNAKDGALMLGAEFDGTYGIPMRYERIEVRTGAHDALQWRVTRFETAP